MLPGLISVRILRTFSIILAVLTTTLAAMQIVRLGPLFLGPWVGPEDARCILALVPFLSAGIPASLSLAIAIEAGSMSRRGERQFLAAAGVKALRVAAAPLGIAAAGAIVVAALSIVAAPAALGVLMDGLSSLAVRAALGTLRSGRFADLPGGGVLYAGHVEARGGSASMRDMLYGREDAGILVVATARKARLILASNEPARIEMEGAVVSIDGSPAADARITGSTASMPLDLGAAIRARTGEVPAVLASGSFALASGLHGEVGTYHLHRRMAEPLGALAILLFAAACFASPFIRRPSSPVAWIAISIICWHAVSRGSEVTFRSGLLDAAVAAWIPAAVAAIALSLALLVVLARRRSSHATRPFVACTRP